jgi:hypothetical protein
MPAPEVIGRYEKAVLWRKLGVTDFAIVTLDKPVEITVRWDDSTIETVSALTGPVSKPTTVVVVVDIPVGSVMRLGALAYLPNPPDQLREVINFKAMKDVKGRAIRRTVTLMNYAGTLPPLAD